MFQALSFGYQIKEVKDIVKIYNDSCFLKFIYYWNLKRNDFKIVSQENGNRLYKVKGKKEYYTKY